MNLFSFSGEDIESDSYSDCENKDLENPPSYNLIPYPESVDTIDSRLPNDDLVLETPPPKYDDTLKHEGFPFRHN
jgi:hypothetical protein